MQRQSTRFEIRKADVTLSPLNENIETASYLLRKWKIFVNLVRTYNDRSVSLSVSFSESAETSVSITRAIMCLLFCFTTLALRGSHLLL